MDNACIMFIHFACHTFVLDIQWNKIQSINERCQTGCLPGRKADTEFDKCVINSLDRLLNSLGRSTVDQSPLEETTLTMKDGDRDLNRGRD